MIRRLNYTGRRRIPRENVRIAIYRNGEMEEFDARVSCGGLGIPDDARLLVEAYHKSDWMRFDFGTVGHVVIPRDRRLTAFYRGARVLFRVKAVATEGEGGKIIAEADRIIPIAPDNDQDRDPLLPVRVVDGLGNQIWRLAWDSGPVLELNRKEPEIKRLLTSDPRFKWLVLPHVLRAVLIRFLSEETDAEDAQSDSNEGQRWLDFALSLYPVEPPKPEDRDPELIENWVNDVVAAFCDRHSVIENWRWSLRPQEDLFTRI